MLGGVSNADIASSRVDLPDPERPTNRKPFSAIGTSVKPLNVPQLCTCNRRMRNCCARCSASESVNRDAPGCAGDRLDWEFMAHSPKRDDG
ncbi:hypothetical protein XPN_4103 [Xanthomonas arboricola pv. pruni MAFF 301427]|nr:hypothetical protein XPN_4103 [Xanthomonas arboricola pv. pruni MAFF 301427]